jgi:HD domain-containing protein
VKREMEPSSFVSAWARAAAVSHAIIDALKSGSKVPAAESWRSAIEDLVEATLEQPSHAIPTAAAERAERTALAAKGIGPRAAHSVGTTMLSAAIGAVLGFDKAALLDLASCAFFADLGFALLPPMMLERGVEMSEEEREELRAAAARALASVLGRSQLSDAFLLRLVAALEQSISGATPHLFSRIVRVASGYDALTRPQPWRPSKSAREALDALAKDEERFDRRIVQVLESVLEALAGNARA